MHPPEMPSWFSNHHPKDRVPNTCWRFTSGESEIFYYQKKFKIKWFNPYKDITMTIRCNSTVQM